MCYKQEEEMAAYSAFLSPQGMIESLGSCIEEGDPLAGYIATSPKPSQMYWLIFVLSHTLNLPGRVLCVYISTHLGSAPSMSPKARPHPPTAILTVRVYKC